MAQFHVLKEYQREDGVFYLPDHDVTLERGDIITMPVGLLGEFDDVFQPADAIAEAFRASVVQDVLVKAGVA